MVLNTTQAFVQSARSMLQDATEPYRYADEKYLEALNFGLLEARRIRPDIYIGVATVPTYVAVDATEVVFEDQFRLALLFYVCHHMLAQDDEEAQDARSVLFLQKFNNSLRSSGA
jgi:hypothetical protein